MRQKDKPTIILFAIIMGISLFGAVVFSSFAIPLSLTINPWLGFIAVGTLLCFFLLAISVAVIIFSVSKKEKINLGQNHAEEPQHARLINNTCYCYFFASKEFFEIFKKKNPNLQHSAYFFVKTGEKDNQNELFYFNLRGKSHGVKDAYEEVAIDDNPAFIKLRNVLKASFNTDMVNVNEPGHPKYQLSNENLHGITKATYHFHDYRSYEHKLPAWDKIKVFCSRYLSLKAAIKFTFDLIINIFCFIPVLIYNTIARMRVCSIEILHYHPIGDTSKSKMNEWYNRNVETPNILILSRIIDGETQYVIYGYKYNRQGKKIAFCNCHIVDKESALYKYLLANNGKNKKELLKKASLYLGCEKRKHDRWPWWIDLNRIMLTERVIMPSILFPPSYMGETKPGIQKPSYIDWYYSEQEGLRKKKFTVQTADGDKLDTIQYATNEFYNRPKQDRKYVICCNGNSTLFEHNAMFITQEKIDGMSTQSEEGRQNKDKLERHIQKQLSLGCAVVNFNYSSTGRSTGKIRDKYDFIKNGLAQYSRLRDKGIEPANIIWNAFSIGGFVSTSTMEFLYQKDKKAKMSRIADMHSGSGFDALGAKFAYIPFQGIGELINPQEPKRQDEDLAAFFERCEFKCMKFPHNNFFVKLLKFPLKIVMQIYLWVCNWDIYPAKILNKVPPANKLHTRAIGDNIMSGADVSEGVKNQDEKDLKKVNKIIGSLETTIGNALQESKQPFMNDLAILKSLQRHLDPTVTKREYDTSVEFPENPINHGCFVREEHETFAKFCKPSSEEIQEENRLFKEYDNYFFGSCFVKRKEPVHTALVIQDAPQVPPQIQ